MLTKERIEEIKKEILNIKIRCSSISSIMTSPNKAELPAGAKTHAENLVGKILYNYTDEVGSKYFDKGHAVEDASIGVYNRVFFKNYEKAEKPASNEYLQTESCDIEDEELDKIIDIKSPWTKKTFPKTVKKATEDAKKAGYPWQLHGYMSIYKRKFGEVAFVFSETPEELCQYEENQSLHFVNYEVVPEELLVTRVQYEFDALVEAQIFARVQALREYALEYFYEILEDHGINID